MLNLQKLFIKLSKKEYFKLLSDNILQKITLMIVSKKHTQVQIDSTD